MVISVIWARICARGCTPTGIFAESGGDPPTDGVFSPGQEVRIVGMQALDADPGTANPGTGPGPFVAVGYQLVSCSLVATMGSLELVGINLGFGNSYCPRRLEPADNKAIVGRYQPEQRRHRPAIVEDRSIADHTR